MINLSTPTEEQTQAAPTEPMPEPETTTETTESEITETSTENTNSENSGTLVPKQTYIESLPSSFTEQDLRELIKPFATRGKVDSLVFKRHITGTQTGFGFITFSDPADADDCQKDLNGRYIQDQVIRCVSSTGYRNNKVSETNLYVEGVPLDWGDEELKEKFGLFGEVSESRIFVNKQTQGRTGVGFVHFTKKEDASKAVLALNETIPEGETKAMKIRFANEPRNKKGRRRGRGRGRSFGGRGWGGPPQGYGRGRGYGPWGGWYGGMNMFYNPYGAWGGSYGGRGRGFGNRGRGFGGRGRGGYGGWSGRGRGRGGY